MSVEPFSIKIENYNKNKKQFISNIVKELEYKYSEEDLKVLNNINNFRRKNNLKILEQIKNLPNFIINEISEVILFE